MQIELNPHPAFPSQSVADVFVDVRLASPGLLDLWYVVQGDLARIVIPPPAEPARADNLWQTTCFELFLSPGGEGPYVELNFSPSGEWAAYSFERYREGRQQAALAEFPVISTATMPGGALETHVTLGFEALASIRPRLFHATAVIEAKGGERSYWAPAHPPGDPDFHHPACFTLELPPPAQA